MGLRSPRSALAHRQGDPTIGALKLISFNLGLSAVAYAAFYLGPDSYTRLMRTPEQALAQVSIVQYVEGLGPVWPFLFALAGGLVLGTTYVGRGVIIGHGIAAGVWVFFGLAIMLGSLLSVPPTPVLSGAAAIFGAITHVGMARAWAGEGVK
ncbi:hypothetical protein [Nocardia phage NC1]|nr:hypothetical protein [Nocardia phage NC1]QSL67731.1 hypothetical protein [Nocardia phage P69]